MFVKSAKRMRSDEEGNAKSKKLKLAKHIPKEILINIFACLTPKDLFHVFLVNKNFHSIANDEYLW
jgi:hypothetical protein